MARHTLLTAAIWVVLIGTVMVLLPLLSKLDLVGNLLLLGYFILEGLYSWLKALLKDEEDKEYND